MYVIPHLKVMDKINSGSCSNYAKYLLKNNYHFFSASDNFIELDTAIDLIDSHSKYKMSANDTKWYAPIYSFSEDECRFVCNKLFKKNYTDYEQLSEQEKLIYNNYFRDIAKQFQDEMAKNFNKEDLGIIDGFNLNYIGVVENSRNYSYEDVKNNDKSLINKKKEGFNTHIHIIQSRRAFNEKKSKISPMANHRITSNHIHGKIGFDRNNFTNRIEKKFDSITNYDRLISNTYEYKKLNSLSNNSIFKSDGVKNFKDLKIFLENNKFNFSKRYIPKKIVDDFLSDFNILDYFYFLESKGILRFKEKKEGDLIYYDLDRDLISVSEKGWINLSKQKSKKKEFGQTIRAVRYFQKFNYLESVQMLMSLSNFNKNILARQNNINKNYSLTEVKSKIFSSFYNQYGNRNINKIIVSKYLTQLEFSDEKKRKYIGVGFRNRSGGYDCLNSKYGSIYTVGKKDISIIEGNSNLVVFKNYLEYLQFLSLNKVKDVKETVIFSNNCDDELIKFLQENKFDKITSVGRISEEISNIVKIENLVQFGINESNSLQDILNKKVIQDSLDEFLNSKINRK